MEAQLTVVQSAVPTPLQTTSTDPVALTSHILWSSIDDYSHPPASVTTPLQAPPIIVQTAGATSNVTPTDFEPAARTTHLSVTNIVDETERMS